MEGYRLIPLQGNSAKGIFAKVSVEDYGELSKYNWFLTQGYAQRNLPRNGLKKRYRLYMHHAICMPSEGVKVDHIDGDTLNNIRGNLRLCTHTENARNRRVSNATSRFKGVHYSTNCKRGVWCAQIRVDKKAYKLGYFEIEEKAARAYDEAALKHFGEFARLNFP